MPALPGGRGIMDRGCLDWSRMSEQIAARVWSRSKGQSCATSQMCYLIERTRCDKNSLQKSQPKHCAVFSAIKSSAFCKDKLLILNQLFKNSSSPFLIDIDVWHCNWLLPNLSSKVLSIPSVPSLHIMQINVCLGPEATGGSHSRYSVVMQKQMSMVLKRKTKYSLGSIQLLNEMNSLEKSMT